MPLQVQEQHLFNCLRAREIYYNRYALINVYVLAFFSNLQEQYTKLMTIVLLKKVTCKIARLEKFDLLTGDNCGRVLHHNQRHLGGGWCFDNFA